MPAIMVVQAAENKKLHKMAHDVCYKCHTSFDCHIMCFVSVDMLHVKDTHCAKSV